MDVLRGWSSCLYILHVPDLPHTLIWRTVARLGSGARAAPQSIAYQSLSVISRRQCRRLIIAPIDLISETIDTCFWSAWFERTCVIGLLESHQSFVHSYQLVDMCILGSHTRTFSPTPPLSLNSAELRAAAARLGNFHTPISLSGIRIQHPN